MSKKDVKKGAILIAEPFLGDPNFERTVVLLCEHNEQGSFGFVLNQKIETSLNDLTEGKFYGDNEIYVGGPVQQNTLHFIHRLGDLIENSVEIMKGLYWGGDFEQTQSLVNTGVIQEKDIRFFLGYSGWGVEQLNNELEQNSWIVTESNPTFIFDTKAMDIWRLILKNMGGKYKQLSNYPIDPRLN